MLQQKNAKTPIKSNTSCSAFSQPNRETKTQVPYTNQTGSIMSAAYPRYSYIISKYVFFFFFQPAFPLFFQPKPTPTSPFHSIPVYTHTHRETHETKFQIPKKKKKKLPSQLKSLTPTPLSSFYPLPPSPLSTHGLKMKLKKKK